MNLKLVFWRFSEKTLHFFTVEFFSIVKRCNAFSENTKNGYSKIQY